MPSFAFSAKGVEDKLSALYALTDSALAQQSIAIKTNFKQWLLSSFNFSAAQTAYVENLDPLAADYYGNQCALCFTARLPITLIYPAPPSDPGYAKWSVSDGGLQVESNSAGQAIISGSLTFRIVYKY